jgi:hypothetical protein
MLDKAAAPDAMRQPAGIGGQPRPLNSSAARNAGNRLADMQRTERERLDRFGRFGRR